MTTTAPRDSADAGIQPARRDTENHTDGMPHLTTYAWDSESISGRGQRLVIAAASSEAACASAGIQDEQWRGIETSDAQEIAVAIESPGVLFWRYVDGDQFYSWELPARPIVGHTAVTPMDAVRQAWPDSVPAPVDVQIDFNKTRTTVTAFLPSGATMSFTRSHGEGLPQGYYDQISHAGDWGPVRDGMPQVREALEKGVVAQRAGMARAAA